MDKKKKNTGVVTWWDYAVVGLIILILCSLSFFLDVLKLRLGFGH